MTALPRDTFLGGRVGEVREPRYCSIDGMTLLDRRVMLSNGFDSYSGVARPLIERVTRECPTDGHDVWVLSWTGAWIESWPRR